MQTLLPARSEEGCFLLPLSFRFRINDLNMKTIALTGLMDWEFPLSLQSGLIVTLMGFYLTVIACLSECVIMSGHMFSVSFPLNFHLGSEV